MGDNAESRAKLEAARIQAVAEQASQASRPQPVAAPATTPSAPKAAPVRSAKDAINAMYAQDPDKRLSSYLAKSAKEIINSGNASGDQKSAASLHQHASKRRIEMERPSASGVLRVASTEQPVIPEDLSHGMDPLAQKTAPKVKPRVIKPVEAATAPVIKTSLKLGPKKTPAPRPVNRTAPSRSLNGQKGRTSLSQFLANRRTVTPAKPSPTTAYATPQAIDPNTAATLQAMRQAVQKTTGQTPETIPQSIPRPKMRAPRGLMQDVIRPGQNPSQPRRPQTPRQVPMPDGLPADSIKRRFQAAPKGYTAAPEVQQASYSPELELTPKKAPVEIYGLMDDEPATKRAELPVIEDYHPDSAKTAAGQPKSTPDNNKYALNGQSPFFLKSVNVEKRPLSGSIGSSKSSSEGTLYERPATTPVSKKNVYDRKEVRKSLPTKPTVIIPASRRSRAPLIFLLILTVILGAAVGAFIYLCFFQYME